ncbi:MAG: hypothetical protein Q4D14_04760 [Bacteroidales bacterium]|nr:hypothetical protein [Bacteroidales bacterium]
MRKKLFYVLFTICMVTMLTACDNPTPEPEPTPELIELTVDLALNYGESYGDSTTNFFFGAMDNDLATTNSGRNYYFDFVSDGIVDIPVAGTYTVTTDKAAGTMVAAYVNEYVGVYQGCYSELFEDGKPVDGSEEGYTDGYMTITHNGDNTITLNIFMTGYTQMRAIIPNSQWEIY